MPPIAVGLSTGVSFISSVTILAYPAHAYIYGTEIMWFGLCTTIQAVISCVYYIPLLHRIHLTSLYEYLELRFNKKIRTAASLVTMANMLFYMGMVIYLTALALDATTPLGMTSSILLTSGLCTLYTTMGGIKAVVWNDVLQSGIMIAGMFAVLIKTTLDVGGIDHVWEAVERGNRNTFWNFSINPTLQHTFWTIFVGNGINWVGNMCTNQALTQRYQSCKNENQAKIACFVSEIVILIMLITATCVGCTIYAYYEGCDPLLNGKISKRDQIVPYLVMEIFRNLPGFAGLFVSAAYSGMLSTVSTGINSMSVLVLQDYILPLKTNLGDATKVNLSKFLCLMLGILVTGIAFLPEIVGTNAVTFAVSIAGSLAGPMLGLFVIAMHFPWTNAFGAAVGLLSGGLLSNWITFGKILYRTREVQHVPFSSHLCESTLQTEASNITIFATTSVQMYDLTTNDLTSNFAQQKRAPFAEPLYSISYMYIGSIGMGVTIVIGLLVSLLSGRNDPKMMNSALFIPLVSNKYFPEKVVEFFHFGVPKYRAKSVTSLADKGFLMSANEIEMKPTETGE